VEVYVRPNFIPKKNGPSRENAPHNSFIFKNKFRTVPTRKVSGYMFFVLLPRHVKLINTVGMQEMTQPQ
jgi:hypothetical protein